MNTIVVWLLVSFSTVHGGGNGHVASHMFPTLAACQHVADNANATNFGYSPEPKSWSVTRLSYRCIQTTVVKP